MKLSRSSFFILSIVLCSGIVTSSTAIAPHAVAAIPVDGACLFSIRTNASIQALCPDGVTQTPTLATPSLGDVYRIGRDTFTLEYSLPETPLSGSVKLRWTLVSDSTTYRELILRDVGGTTAFDIPNPIDVNSAMSTLANVLGSSTQIQGTPSDGTLPPGTYDFLISYQNDRAYPAATATANNVALQVRCDLGYHSNDGYTPCAPARAGHYAVLGGTEDVPCPKGQFQPNTSSFSCIPAPVGFYVPETGAIEAIPCPAGSTTATSGLSNCTVTEAEQPLPSSSTTVPVINSTSSTSPTTTSSPSPVVITATQKTCAVRKGRNISRSCLLKNAKIAVAASSRFQIKISASSNKICKLSGGTVKTFKTGTCSTTLTVTPKGKKAKTYKERVTVVA